MNQTARLTSRGRITIPLAVRKELGLRTGCGVVFERVRDGFQMRRLKRGGAFESYRGIGNPGIPSGRAGVREYTRQLRGR